MLKRKQKKLRGLDSFVMEYVEQPQYIPEQQDEVNFINRCIKELNDTITLANHIKNNNPENSMIYTTRYIPKKTGGKREINEPTPILKKIQKSIVHLLRETFQIKESNVAHAYVKNRSSFTSRMIHRDNKSKWFLRLDMENYFPSCTPEYVSEKIKQIYPIAVFPDKYKQAVCDLISAYCFLNNGLPQGSPSSPFISNIVFIENDLTIIKKLNEIKSGFKYTRYCDDFEISHRVNFNYKEIIAKLNDIIHPFTFKAKKTSYGNNNVIGVWNLGILYNSAGEFSLGKEKRMDLQHAILNTIAVVKDGGKVGQDFANVWLGKINHFKQINNTQTENILEKYNRKFDFDMVEHLKSEVRNK